METIKDRGSVNKPHVLDGTNYDYWKGMMVDFLKSLGNKAWKVMIKGWKHPMITSEEGVTNLKLEADRTDAEALGNSKVLNAFLNGVDKNMFILINTCSEAKEAWEILKSSHEGTSKVCMSRLQLLTTKFENLRMNEDETMSEFHIRLCHIANTSFALGEKMYEEKLVKKILKSLSKRFDIKVTTIEEAQDLSSIKVDEFIGSLQTFEMSIVKG